MIFVKRPVFRVAALVTLLACATAVNAQLVQKKAASQADSVNLTGKQPLVYSDSATLKNERAASDAKAAINLEYSNDSLTGTLIGIGAEFVGQTVKNILSPNSAEADAVELERTRR